MKMINKNTGVVADLPPEAGGGAWAPLHKETEDKKPMEESTNEENLEEPEKEALESDEITKKEIMQELDALGVRYDRKATKQELYDLMMKG